MTDVEGDPSAILSTARTVRWAAAVLCTLFNKTRYFSSGTKIVRKRVVPRQIGRAGLYSETRPQAARKKLSGHPPSGTVFHLVLANFSHSSRQRESAGVLNLVVGPCEVRWHLEGTSNVDVSSRGYPDDRWLRR